MRSLRIALSALALCLLQSCGGGGGGGGGGPNNSSFTITLDRTTISFDAFEGEFPPGQLINATARGEYSGDQLFVGATVEGQGIDPAIQITILSETNAQIAVRAASGLAAGTYAGRMFFHACSDQACATHVGGTPIAVNYTVTVRRGAHTTPSTLHLTSVSGAGTSGDVTVQFPDGANAFTLQLLTTQLDWMSVSNVGSDSFTVDARSMPVGGYAGTILVGSGGSTTSLNVEYIVTAPPGGEHGIIADPQPLTFSTSEGGQDSKTLLLTPPSWNPGLNTFVADTPPAPWLTLTPITGGYTVTASAASLSLGTYSATIVVATIPAHEQTAIPVTLTVGPGLVKPATTVIGVDSDTTLSQLSGSARIDIADGPPVNWTASTTVPWLTLTRAAGLTGTDVEFTVDPTTVNGWDNFSDHATTIHIEAASGALTPMDCDVEVRLRFAEVTGVGPYLLIAGQSSKAIVRGRGFTQLANPSARLRIDNGAAVSATLVNDTQLAVDVGALALGSHAVRVTNALNRSLQTRNLKVVPAASYAYKAMPMTASDVQWPFMYDAERQNAYIQARPLGLLRFPVTSASTVVQPVSDPGGLRLGVTADGANYVTGDQTRFALLDPDTLATVPGTELATFDTRNPSIYGLFPMGMLGLMVSNDSRMWYDDFHWLQLDTMTTGRVTELAPGTPTSGQQEPRAMSRNGAHIVGVDWSSSPPMFESFPLYYLDTADSVLRYRSDPVITSPQIMLSDDGERVLMGYSKVLDAQLQDFGDIVLPPSASAYDPLIAALSPDGARVYLLTYLRADFNQPAPTVPPRVYVFDSSTPVSAPATLPVLGYFEFDDYPGCLRSDCYSQTFANITPDGGALLFVGNRNFVVVPTDAGLTAAATAPGNQKTGSSALRTVPWRR